MLCTFCSIARLDNEAPCPHCGAPSPLITGTIITGTNGGYGASLPVLPPTDPWGEVSTTGTYTDTYNAMQGSKQTSPFSSPTQMSPMQMSPTMSQQAQQVQAEREREQARSSLLPVPYHPPQQQHPFSTMGMTYGQNGALVPLPEQGRELSAHSFPGEDIATPIYVPPMYTKPRAIIPRYRIISGLLSVLIVTAFLCVGAGYYLKVSGKLTAISQLAGFVPPANIQLTATPPLPNPTATMITGPAYNIINSATTTSKIDPKTYLAIEPDTVFKINTPIYVTYSVQNPKNSGIMTVKWYTNGAFYQASPPLSISKAISGYDQQEYSQPAEGKVELYWNNQLAITLFFVVR